MSQACICVGKICNHLFWIGINFSALLILKTAKEKGLHILQICSVTVPVILVAHL